MIRPGEPAGEMALIADTPHSADVVALRDSEIIALPRDVFFEACEPDPAVMIELARLMLLRSRQATGARRRATPSVFGFVGCSADVATRGRRTPRPRDRERSAIRSPPPARSRRPRPTEWFSDVEQAHDFVLYVADSADWPGSRW